MLWLSVQLFCVGSVSVQSEMLRERMPEISEVPSTASEMHPDGTNSRGGGMYVD